MTGKPSGIVLIEKCPVNVVQTKKQLGYRVFILIFTFCIYTSYHLSRKAISVVKSVLFINCTEHMNLSSIHTDANGSFSPIINCGSWPPFDGANHQTLLGGLDLSFLFAYAVGMFISGQIAERLSLRYFLTGGMLLCGVFTCLFGLGYFWNIHSLTFYLVVQALGGFVQSTGWPSVVTCVANWFGKGNRGLIMGLWNSHTSVGNILGSFIAGAFVDSNWGLSFIVPGAIIGTLGIVVFFFLVPEPKDVDCQSPVRNVPSLEHTEVVSDDEQYATENKAINSSTMEERPLIESQTLPEQRAISFSAALFIPGVIEFSLCLFFAKLVSYTFLFWLPDYIHNTSNFDASISADMSTLFDVGGIVGGVVAGVISDRAGGRATTCFFMLLLASPMLFVYQRFGNNTLYLNIIFLMIVGCLVNGPYALITTAVSADLGTHDSLRGNAKALATVTAIIDGTGSVGAALGPLLTGVISPTGWQNVFYMLIGANICAMIFLCRLVLKEVQGFLPGRVDL